MERFLTGRGVRDVDGKPVDASRQRAVRRSTRQQRDVDAAVRGVRGGRHADRTRSPQNGYPHRLHPRSQAEFLVS